MYEPICLVCYSLIQLHPWLFGLLVLIKVNRREKSKTSTIPLTEEGKYALKNYLLLNLYISSCTADLLSKLTEIPRNYISRKLNIYLIFFVHMGWIRAWLLSLCQPMGQTMWRLIEKVTKTNISMHLFSITHILQYDTNF